MEWFIGVLDKIANMLKQKIVGVGRQHMVQVAKRRARRWPFRHRAKTWFSNVDVALQPLPAAQCLRAPVLQSFASISMG